MYACIYRVYIKPKYSVSRVLKPFLSLPSPASYEVRTRGECVWVGRWVRTGWPRQDVGGVGGREGSLPAARRGWNVGTARGGKGHPVTRCRRWSTYPAARK